MNEKSIADRTMTDIALDDLTRPIVGIENRTAQEVFDIMCDRLCRASPSEVAPANPAQVTDAMVERACDAYHAAYPDGTSRAGQQGMSAALTAAIGAGGQAVAEARKLLLWAADSFDARAKCTNVCDEIEGYEESAKMYRECASRLSSTSQPHPADERVVEARNYETFRTFAHEATKAITNLTGGGSEYFGKEVDGVFLADLPRCVERLRHRLDRAALSAKECRLDG